MLIPNTLLQERYLIERPIGQGGMGAVYEATDTRLNAKVALKEMLLTDDSSRRSFEREAKLLARLRHAALPKVIDHFIEAQGQFLVMEFIPGDDLAVLLEKSGGSFPPVKIAPWIMRWADQLLDALDYLHNHTPPVIHRDIKPQNMKLTARQDIILLDFGLAKGGVADKSVVSGRGSESILGYTLNYAPLEQIQGSEPDPRSDLFSLAATLYHLATGEKPPDAMNRAMAMLNGEVDPLVPINTRNPHIPPAVADVLYRAMAPNPELRPPDARTMRQWLKQANQTRNLASPTEFTGDTMQITRALPPHVLAIPIGGSPPQPAVQAPAAPKVGTLLQTFSTSFPILCLAVSPDGKTIAVGGEGEDVEVRQVSDGNLLKTLEGHTANVHALAFSPDGKMLVTGSEDKTVGLWVVNDCWLAHRFTEVEDPVYCVAFSPDGKMLVAGGWGQTLCFWRMKDGKLANRLEQGESTYCLGFSPDGKTLGVGCYDTTVRLWWMSDGHLLHTMEGHANIVLSLVFSPDGRLVASGSGDTQIKLWRIKDGRLRDTLSGHTNFVRSLAFSPDGQTLASASEDKTVRLWRVSDGSLIQTLTGATEGVTCVTFSPDGQMVIAGSRDGKLRFWQRA